MKLWRTIILESLDIESGIIKTFKDLLSKPEIVLNSYCKKEKIYSSPIRIFISLSGALFLVLEFLFDWKKVGLEAGMKIDEYFGFDSTTEVGLESLDVLSTMLDTLMTKIAVPIIIIYVIIYIALLSYKVNSKRLGIEIEKIVYSVCYSSAYSLLFLFVLLLIWGLGIIFFPIFFLFIFPICCLIFLILYMIFYKKLSNSYYHIGVHRFFPNSKEMYSMTKKFEILSALATLFLLIIFLEIFVY